jgi:hypothetical protein
MVDLFFDEQENLWVLDLYGLYSLDGNSLVPLDHPGQETLIRHGYYWVATLDSVGVCWLFSQGSGVWSLDLITQELKQHDYEHESEYALIHNYSIATAFLDADGDIWGSASSGIFNYDQSVKGFINSDSPMLTSDGSSLGTPRAFAQDASGTIFLGQFLNRLATLRKEKLRGQSGTILTAFSHLPPSRVYDMMFDMDGDLWIASNDGIARYDTASKKVDFFGASFGFSRVSDLNLSSDDIILASVDGKLITIDPYNLPSNDLVPRPVITGFRVFDQTYQSQAGQRVPYIRQVSLRHTQNFFSFDFGAIDFTSQQVKEFAYQLEGLDREWNYPEKGRQYAAYTNVGGGRFVFRVKVRNPGGDWSADEATLIVSITPPIWQRPWFILCSVAFLITLIWVMYRYRINEIKKKEALITAFNKQLAETEMKALRAQMNPHFLFNTLNAIKLYVQKNDQERAVEYLTDFAKLIRQVLQNSGKALIP